MAILKDLNWVGRKRELALGPEKKALFEEQLRRDTELMQKLRIMDYSLLTGIHNVVRGNVDNLRDGLLTVFQVRSRSSSLLEMDRADVRSLLARYGQDASKADAGQAGCGCVGVAQGGSAVGSQGAVGHDQVARARFVGEENVPVLPGRGRDSRDGG